MSELTITHCPYCSLNCGLRLRVDGGQVVATEKWKGAPLSHGGLCTKGITAWEQIHHPDRLLTPLVRRGTEFVAASWDAALDEAAAGLGRIRDQHGPDALAVLGGGSLTNEKAYLLGKFARLALRTPHIDPNGRMCMTSAGAAAVRAFGVDRAMTPLAHVADTDLLVVVGANLPDAFPLVMPYVAKARKRGTQLVVIDPRGSNLLRSGDLHLAVRTGSDAALAAGLLREVGLRGGLDWGFIRERTTGFHEVWEAVQRWTLDRTAAATGVATGDLETAAGLLAAAPRAMILHARGIEQHTHGTDTVLSWINLALARGLAGRPGCGIVTMTGQRNGQGGREHGQRCDQLPGYRNIEDPAHRAEVAMRWGVRPEELPGRGLTFVEILQAAGDGRIKGALSISTNPAVSAPRGARARAGLGALEHLVVIDPFFSETCRYATVVLPGSTFGEEDGTITTTEGRVVRVDRAVPPLAARGDLDILRGLARRLGVLQHFDFHTGREVFDELITVSAGGVADYSGLDWDSLRDRGGIFWPAPTSRPEGTPLLHTERFGHPDGRARFTVIDPRLPEVASDADFPLILTTGRHRAHYLSGNQTRRIAAQVRQAPAPVLEIHPDTATALGLGNAKVVVTSRRGAVELEWQPNPALRSDTVFVAWHWEGINDLTDDALDPVSRIPGFKHTPVRVSPAAAPEVAGDVPVMSRQHARSSA